METYIQLLIFVTIGVVLLWFALALLIQWLRIRLIWRDKPALRDQSALRDQPDSQTPSAPTPAGMIKDSTSGSQFCPICSSPLKKGELVSTLTFPSAADRDRLMHIRGCVYCLRGGPRRICPVCKADLRTDEMLIARMFDRTGRKPHVHVLGCSRCRRAGS
jgi:hypothetical protein